MFPIEGRLIATVAALAVAAFAALASSPSPESAEPAAPVPVARLVAPSATGPRLAANVPAAVARGVHATLDGRADQSRQ